MLRPTAQQAPHMFPATSVGPSRLRGSTTAPQIFSSARSMSHHLRKVRPVRGRRLRNATHEKSGRESDLEGAERIPSGIRSEARTISSASARTGQFAHYRIYFYTTGVSYD